MSKSSMKTKLPLQKPSYLEKSVLDHIHQFMLKTGLYPRQKGERSLVGVSGGVDSMLLSWALVRLFKKMDLPAPIWVHINHGTRKEALEEEAMVRKMAQKEQCEIEIFRAPRELREGGNFEARARATRRDHFHFLLKKYSSESLYLAHHVDDSFEWFFLQLLRSCQSPLSLGIPVRNGPLKRPLHCLTKGQIYFMAQTLGIAYREDESNQNQRFDRNFIRHSLIPSLKKRYPSYLKHYVKRSNEMAHAQGLCALPSSPKATLVRDRLGGVCLLQMQGRGDFLGQEEKIRQALFLLSSQGRGTLGEQIKKLIEAQREGKKGPMEMSGGVSIFMDPGSLLFLTPSLKKLYGEWDKQIAEYVKNLEDSQIPRALFSKASWQVQKEKLIAPFWIVGNKLKEGERQREGPFESSLQEHPLFPHLLRACSSRQLWIRPMGHVFFLLPSSRPQCERLEL